MQCGSWPLLLTACRDSTNKRMLSAVSLRPVHPSEVQMTSRRSLCGAIAGVAFAAAAAAPDGYTILLHSSSLSSQVVLHRTLPYDPIRDFTPVVMFGIQPNVLVAAPSTGFKTVADLVAAAKARLGALT